MNETVGVAIVLSIVALIGMYLHERIGYRKGYMRGWCDNASKKQYSDTPKL